MSNQSTETLAGASVQPVVGLTTKADDPGWLDNWPRENWEGAKVVYLDELLAAMKIRHDRDFANKRKTVADFSCASGLRMA